MSRLKDSLNRGRRVGGSSSIAASIKIKTPLSTANCRLTRDRMAGLTFAPVATRERAKYVVKGSRRLLAHTEFFEWLFDPRSDPKQVKRARHLATQILTRGYAPNTKSVRGVAAGWQRAGLGGTGGSHDYLWYAQGGTSLGRELGLSDDEALLRTVRFHDDTDQSVPVSTPDDYLELESTDLLDPSAEESSSSLNSEQYRAATVQPHPITTIRGFPGSGKTTTLQFSASAGVARSILYLTFNKKLATEARRYFDYFTPEGSKVQVMSFEQFLEFLADVEDGMLRLIPPSEASQLLASRLKTNPAIGFGEWSGHLDELYADFHAFGVGAALPFAFRGAQATAGFTLSKSDYRKLRVDTFGSASDLAASFLEQLDDPAALLDLFPGPCLSRSLLRGADEPPPPGFEDFDGIFVDEVQDLTLVELALIFNVAVRISVESGRMPHLVLAGDESQTVRPTDFGWAELRELAREFFPEVDFTDSVLTSNLRSPERIGKIVEASSNQYDLFARSIRPRGQVQTLLDQDMPGQVTHCELPDKSSLEELLRLVDQLPRTCLVYPGSRIPDDIAELDETGIVWSADEVKGLDYETTIVLDAGERQVALRRRVQSGNSELAAIWGRTLADQFRVCVSRSTNKLVLIDRSYFDSAFGKVADRLPALHELIQDSDDYPEVVDFADLDIELSNDVDPEEVLLSIAGELPQLTNQNPDRALRRVAAGRRKLEEATLLGEVPKDVAARFEAASATTVALVGFDRLDSPEGTRLLSDAKALFDRAGLGEDFEAVSSLLRVLGNRRNSSKQIVEVFADLSRSRDLVRTRFPELTERLERSITQWMNATFKRAPDLSDSDLRRTVRCLNIASDAFSDSLAFIAGTKNSGLTEWGRLLVAEGRFDEALSTIENVPGVDDLRALCHENLGDFEAACDIYFAINDRASAVRVARRGGMLSKAMELDDGSDSEVSETLRWLADVERAIGSSRPRLLDEEMNGLVKLLAEQTGIRPESNSSRRRG